MPACETKMIIFHFGFLFPMGCANSKNVVSAPPLHAQSNKANIECANNTISILHRVGSSKTSCIRRLAAELEEIQSSHDPFGIVVDEYAMTHWTAGISGPPETPFNGGSFTLDLIFPTDYPFVPPLVTFRTPIFHPNVSTTGAICLDILKPRSGTWSPLMTVPSLLVSIQSLLGDANPDDPLNLEAAELLRRSPQAFARRAKADTMKYATARGSSARISPREDPSAHFQQTAGGKVIDEDDAMKLALTNSRRTRYSNA